MTVKPCFGTNAAASQYVGYQHLLHLSSSSPTYSFGIELTVSIFNLGRYLHICCSAFQASPLDSISGYNLACHQERVPLHYFQKRF